MKYNFHHISPHSIIFLIVLITACTTGPAGSSRHPGSRPESFAEGTHGQEESRETVRINGETYRIPPPWSGNRFTAPEFDSTDFRPIPVEYTLNGSKVYIVETAHQPLVDLLQAAEREGVMLKVESAYRSERYQKRIFKRMLAEGRTFDDIIRYVAPPGYSQHMLGTAVDFYPSDWSFAGTDAYTWLRENSRHFGFEETYSRYNPMQMPWESWHWNFTREKEADAPIPVFSPAPMPQMPGPNQHRRHQAAKISEPAGEKDEILP